MRILAVILILTCIYGCGTFGAIGNLKNLSTAREEQELTLKTQEARFTQLLKDFSEGKLAKGTLKEKIIEDYGEPINEKKIKTGSSFTEEFIYRHPSQFFGSEKLFLYFNKNGKLIGTKYLKPEIN